MAGHAATLSGAAWRAGSLSAGSRPSSLVLCSLYDAPVSLNVPNDRARAVVDAMERDMGTTLATKFDLQTLRQELRPDMALLKQELVQEVVLVRKDMDLLRSSMTIRLGSMLFVGLGLLFAALKLT